MYTVYQNPIDFPGKVVVRGCSVGGEGVKHDAATIFVGHSIADARAAILAVAPGAVPLSRWEDDEPQIVEIWL
jgi:hypothetical protein